MPQHLTTYFSTFPTGTEEIVKSALHKRGSEKIQVLQLTDGLVLYSSSYSLRDIRQIRFFNNTFTLLTKFEKGSFSNIEDVLRLLIKSATTPKRLKKNLLPDETFKIVTTVENRTVSVNRDTLTRLERIIIKETGARLSIKQPQKELWIIVRREGFTLFGIRNTYPHPKRNRPRKGELSTELAHLLILASKPSPKDVMLDSFAGYGSIPVERAQAFPYKEIIAIEKDPAIFKELQRRVRSEKKRITLHQADGTDLSMLEDGSISTIVTDPPWGLYKSTRESLDVLYKKMVDEFIRVLKQNGCAVILSGAKEILEKVLTERGIRYKKHDVLVSGKKAGVYIFQKQTRKRGGRP